jgi:cobalt/nickel transport system permease protein
MHIPNSMLQGTICPVTAVISAVGVALAALTGARSSKKPAATRFATVTAFIFAAQMLNFPIQDGTSGHFIGGVLAASLLGVPFGILSMALVVTVQCVVFSDGGFAMLGANVFNMAVIGAGAAGILRERLISRFSAEGSPLKRYTITGICAWLAVVLAALCCSAELALSGTISFMKVAGAMLGVHAIIGIGEALITVAAERAYSGEPLTEPKKASVALPLLASGMIAGLLSPFASSFPDGLEWVAAKYRFLHEAAPSFASPLPDYMVPFIGNEALSTGAAGLIGVALTFAVALLCAKAISWNRT